NLNFSIKQIRAALGDNARTPTYIETLPRRGYRFLARPERPVSTPERSAPEAEPAQPAISSKGRRRWALTAVALLVLLAGAGLLALRWRARTPSFGKTMVLVLPCEDLSGQAGQEYLAGGLTEELMTRLGQLDPARLGVIAATAAGGRANTREMGRQFGAAYVLQGSLRTSGRRIRVAARLYRASDRVQTWSENYDRDLTDVLALESELAEAIAREVHVRLAPREMRAVQAHAVDPETHGLYLKGRFFWRKRGADGLKKAIEYFEQAVAKDPDYAAAYAGLSDSYGRLAYYSGVAPAQWLTRSREAALKAVALDPALAEAHTAMARIKMEYEWDWKASEEEYRRAIELNPSDASAHHDFAYYYTAVGRSGKALQEALRAVALDPLSAHNNNALATQLFFARQYPQAVEQHRAALELESQFPLAHAFLGLSYGKRALWPEAIAECESAVTISHAEPFTLGALAQVYAAAGRVQKARELLARMRAAPYPPPYEVALVYAVLGDRDEAFRWLSRAEAERAPWLTFIRSDPRADGLRGDPRYNALLRRLHLSS
ncbi:MAG: tetratricopeptide repeat protein, partial [Acidobacteria bacterium]|nr:tetratricopeptide repeat protein [Acidobacteriota bacterium]